MFADPQSVTIGGDTTSLPRTGAGIGIGSFSSSDGSITLDVKQSYGRRNRRTARLTVKTLSADPLTPSNNVPVTGAFYVVADFPVQGFTAAQQKDIAVALITRLTASSNAALVQLLGGEA